MPERHLQSATDRDQMIAWAKLPESYVRIAEAALIPLKGEALSSHIRKEILLHIVTEQHNGIISREDSFNPESGSDSVEAMLISLNFEVGLDFLPEETKEELRKAKEAFEQCVPTNKDSYFKAVAVWNEASETIREYVKATYGIKFARDYSRTH